MVSNQGKAVSDSTYFYGFSSDPFFPPPKSTAAFYASKGFY